MAKVHNIKDAVISNNQMEEPNCQLDPTSNSLKSLKKHLNSKKHTYVSKFKSRGPRKRKDYAQTGKFECEECGRRFGIKFCLNRHLMTVHKKQPEIRPKKMAGSDEYHKPWPKTGQEDNVEEEVCEVEEPEAEEVDTSVLGAQVNRVINH